MPRVTILRYQWLKSGGDADICAPPQAHKDHSLILMVEVLSLVMGELAMETLKAASAVPRQRFP